MKTKVILTLALIVVSVSCEKNLEGMNKLMNLQDDPMAPNEFNFMLLLSSNLHKQIDIGNMKLAKIPSKIHQTDLIANAYNHHQETGGSHQNAYIMTHNQESKTHFSKIALNLEKTENTIVLSKKTGVSLKLKHSGIKQCVNSHNIGVKITEASEPTMMNVQLGDRIIKISKEDMETEGLNNLFEDICKLMEFSKNQRQENLKTLAVTEFKNLDVLISGKYGQQVKQVVENTLKMVIKNLETVYGPDNLGLMAVAYESLKGESSERSRRILADTAVEVTSDSKGANNISGGSFVYNFGVFFFFLVLFVCVEIYRMEVYKDSLVYSNFITSRKAD